MRLPAQLHKSNLDTHKGDYGYCLVVGASPGLTGAVCLCAQAALSAGAGLVRVGVPRSLNSIFEIKLTEVMSLPLEDDGGYLSPKAFSQIEAISDKIDAIALGCGASLNPSAQELILKVIEKIDKPLVVDADGINALAKDLEILKKAKTKNLILTPHLGEFSRLLGQTAEQIKPVRKKLVKDFAFEYNLTLVLKGHYTLVSDGQDFFQNRTGNPGMATAGSGDVLTGIITAFIAQGLAPFEAAKFGVYLHGLSGDLAAKEKTKNCLIASDLVEYLPKAFKRSL